MRINLRESDNFFLRLICILFFFGYNASLYSQYNVQINLEASSSKDVFLAGNINNWNPADSNYLFRPTKNGLQLAFKTGQKELEFKLTQGSWSRVEKNQEGMDVPNRKHSLQKGNNSIQIIIQKWGDGTTGASTRTEQVKILTDSFFSQSLDKYRRIWIYLPKNYKTDTLSAYPVWYMHDGQNLFDNSTSYSGEWKIDEILGSLEEKGENTAIIVGIDNGGIERMNEYSPWENEKYKQGGKGDAYLDFLTQELKPFIDSTYRTLTCRQYTTIGGSSMGGLISLYGLLRHQEIFGNALVFSPAFWFAKSELDSFLVKNPIELPSKIHFLAGKLEGPEYVKDMDSVRAQLAESQELQYDYVVKELGEHNEAFWESEFESAFKFLNTNPSELVLVESDTWMPKAYPCPGTTVTYTISKNMLPFQVEIDGGKVLNNDAGSSRKLIVFWEKDASESLLVLHKERK